MTSVGFPDWSSAAVPGFSTPVFNLPATAVVGGNASTNFTIPNGSYRTLIAQITVQPGTVSNISIGGLTTDLLYYNQPPYLPPIITIATTYTVICPILGAIEAGYQLAVTCPGATQWSAVVYADSFSYDESVLYNGIVQNNSVALAAIGTTTVQAGPIRLLNAFLEVAPGGTGLLIMNSRVVARLDVPAGQNVQSISLPYPPNTILSKQTLVQVQSTAAVVVTGAVQFAYP